MADESISSLKTCSKCGEAKPATREHFQHYNNRGKVLAFTFCRVCMNARNRDYRAQNPEKTKEWDKRNAIKNKAPGSEYNKRRYARKDKAKARDALKEWKRKNPEKSRAIERRRLERINSSVAEREKRSARVAKWQRDNPDKVEGRRRRFHKARPEATAVYSRRYREKNLEKTREKDRRWRENNRDKMLAQVERRRARMMEAQGEFTGHDVIAMIKKTGRVCFYCGDNIKKFQIDHFIPLSRGGTNWPDNIVISCRSCNLRKGAKMPWDWMPDRFAPPAVE